MPLTEEERQAIEARLREEMQQEHDRKLEALRGRKESFRERSRAHRERKHIAEVNELRDKVREDFCKDHGYMRYVDSTGRESWLPPEEYEWRMKRRGHRSHSLGFSPSTGGGIKQIVFYVAIAGLAFILGLFIALRGL